MEQNRDAAASILVQSDPERLSLGVYLFTFQRSDTFDWATLVFTVAEIFTATDAVEDISETSALAQP